MEENKKLENQIEALLFAGGDPLAISSLAKICEKSEAVIREALLSLKNSLSNRGIMLVYTEKEASLATSPETEGVVNALHQEEITKPLGRAGLETLSIVLYQGPVTKSHVDYIRGVNSASILRNLMIRGLIERKENPKNKRGFIYVSSMDTLRYLGISSVKDLPSYEETKKSLDGELENQDS